MPADEQDHVEAYEAPHNHEHRGDHGGVLVTQPGKVLELVQAHPGEDAVQQPAGGIVDLPPHDANGHCGNGVREERDHAVEAGIAQSLDLAFAASADRYQRGKDQTEDDGDDREEDHQDDVVGHRLHEDVVGKDLHVVFKADEVLVRRKTGPVRQRISERLDERPNDEQEVDRQRQSEEDGKETDLVPRQRLPPPLNHLRWVSAGTTAARPSSFRLC